MRSFEVPAIGGIMLAPDTPEHRLFFENGREVFLFNSATDAAALIKSLIAMTVEAVMEMRYSARQRSIISGYSYKDRTQTVLSELRTLHG